MYWSGTNHIHCHVSLYTFWSKINSNFTIFLWELFFIWVEYSSFIPFVDFVEGEEPVYF